MESTIVESIGDETMNMLQMNRVNAAGVKQGKDSGIHADFNGNDFNNQLTYTSKGEFFLIKTSKGSMEGFNTYF